MRNALIVAPITAPRREKARALALGLSKIELLFRGFGYSFSQMLAFGIPLLGRLTEGFTLALNLGAQPSRSAHCFVSGGK